jgi:hypothetical protein
LKVKFSFTSSKSESSLFNYSSFLGNISILMSYHRINSIFPNIGTLDLYNLDADSQPHDIVKSIVPVRNSFVFFEVTPNSYHQVSEVLSDKDRLSISGWFHGENIVRPAPFFEPALVKVKFEPRKHFLIRT